MADDLEEFEDAWAAYHAGEYQKAMRLWKPLAEQGNAFAQHGFGTLYGHGQGVPDAQAVTWYRKAAEQGYAPAQGHDSRYRIGSRREVVARIDPGTHRRSSLLGARTLDAYANS